MNSIRRKKVAQKAQAKRICKRPFMFALDEAGFVKDGHVVYVASPLWHK